MRLPAAFGQGRWESPRPDKEKNGLPLWGGRPFLSVVLAAAPWFWRGGQSALVCGFLRATGSAGGEGTRCFGGGGLSPPGSAEGQIALAEGFLLFLSSAGRTSCFGGELLLLPDFVRGQIALAGGSCCSLVLPGEKLLRQRVFCRPLILSEDRLLWQGAFCYSLALLGDKLLWHRAFCYRLVLLGVECFERGLLQGRCRGREKEGALWRGMARAGVLNRRWPSLFTPAAGREAVNRVRRPRGVGLV